MKEYIYNAFPKNEHQITNVFMFQGFTAGWMFPFFSQFHASIFMMYCLISLGEITGGYVQFYITHML